MSQHTRHRDDGPTLLAKHTRQECLQRVEMREEVDAEAPINSQQVLLLECESEVEVLLLDLSGC